jgi:RNA polymerase sigma factor (sigma-70 family)
MSETDLELLARYTGQNTGQKAEDAFEEIVRRHLDLVHSAALRQVRSPHLAEEVAQSAFLKLARHARQLAPDTNLSAWLYQVTRREAVNVIRREAGRQLREQIATEMNAINASDADWSHIEPMLDEAMQTLGDSDRAAVLLRYFENKSLREVGRFLGTSEDTAQKRVSRAIDHLREYFAQHGVTLSANGLSVVISANAIQAAPIGVASAISYAATTIGSVASASTAVTASKTITMTIMQKTAIAAAFTAAVGAGLYESSRVSRLQIQLQEARAEQSRLAAPNQQSKQARDETANSLRALTQENERLRGDRDELLKLRGEYARLNRDSHELAKLKATETNTNDSAAGVMKSWMSRVNLLKQRLEQQPNLKIPELQLVTDQDWLNAAHDNLETDEDYRRALAELRSAGQGKFASLAQPALGNYLKANNGQFPTDLAQLQPYFASPVDGAILQRYEIIPAAQLSGLGMGGDWVITTKAPVDIEYDSQVGIGPNGHGSIDYKSSVIQALNPIVSAFGAANNGQEPTELSQLQPYATTPDQQAALAKAIRLGIPSVMSSVRSVAP